MEEIVKIKKIDPTGRIVIPEDIRDKYGFTPNTMLDMIGTREGVLIRKYEYKLVKIDKTEGKRDMEMIGEPRDIDASGRLVILEGFRERYAFAPNSMLEIIAIEEGVLIRNPGYMLVKVGELEQN